MANTKFQNHIPNKRPVGKQHVSKPIAGRTDMKRNKDKAFVFETPVFKQLERFLILGVQGGTYYASEEELAKENVQVLDLALKEDYKKTIEAIVSISDSGRCVKNDTCIFAIAYAASHPDNAVRKLALKKVRKICRIGTHLFAFVEYSKYFRGRGRGFKQVLQGWYLFKSAGTLSYQLAKYQQRNSWSHRDVLRLCKPVPKSEAHSTILKWSVGKASLDEIVKANSNGELKCIEGFERAKVATTDKEIIDLIDKYDLSREMIPTQFLNRPVIQAALLPKTPYGALIRNLGLMTSSGLLANPLEPITEVVYKRILDEVSIKRSRIHPMALLVAYLVYNQGKGVKGSATWVPNQAITDALEKAFYLSFGFIKPTNKKTVIALDVSSSMGWENLMGIQGLTPKIASAVMALTVIKSEKPYNCLVKAFSNDLMDIHVNPSMSLKELMETISKIPFGSTNIGLVIEDAIYKNIKADSFIFYTDNEVNHGQHVSYLLKEYRHRIGKPEAKAAFVAMTASRSSVADPKDDKMMNFVGFDTSLPSALSEFLRS